MKVYSSIGPAYRWLLLAWIWTAALTSPALLCSSKFAHTFEHFCGVYGWIGIIATLFGPALIMPLFLILILTKRLGILFYPIKTNPANAPLIVITLICLILAAALSVILFIVPISTLDVPALLYNKISSNSFRYVAEVILCALWLTPAGMLYLLALFMIQFGFLRETLIQGYKPILIYILSGGITAFVYSAGTTISGNFSLFTPPDFFIPLVQKFSSMGFEVKFLNAAFNPYLSLILNFIAPLPMLILFKLCLTDRIIPPKKSRI